MVTQLTEREAAAMGPRSMKPVGSVAWCWQTVTALQYMWENLDLSFESYARAWAEAEEEAIWEKIPSDAPYGSKAAMIEQLAIGDDEGARAKVAALAAVTKPLKKHGGHLRRNGKEGATEHLPRGSSQGSYLSARIARDHPVIYRRMLNGEFPSVAAAAREAGIMKPRTKTVSLSPDVGRVAGNIRKHYTPDQVETLVKELQADSASD